MIFNPINGFDISKDFFENGECCVEAQIESEICQAIRYVCPYIKIRKSKLSGGFTDGIIKLYDDKGNYYGFIINESKRDQDNRLESAYIQAMFYAGSFLYDVSFDKEINSKKFLGFFLTNAYEFVWLPKKDIPTESFKPLWLKYSYMCPNKAAKEVLKSIVSISFNHLFKLNEDFRLDYLLKDIYDNKY